MGAGKWIGGILGFMTMGPLGALAGFALGSLLDGNNGLFGNTYEKGQAEAGNYDEGQRNSFLFSMLVMASYIIRADGRIMHSEMEYVRQFLRMNFGEEAVIQGEQILLNLFEQRKQMERQNPMAFKNSSIKRSGTMHGTVAQRSGIHAELKRKLIGRSLQST